MRLMMLFWLGLFLAACAAAPRWAQAQDSEVPVVSEDEEEPKPKPKKKAKKKGYDYEASKYKSFRVDPEPSSYKFNSAGEPIDGKKKKKPKKKVASVPEEEIDGVAPLDDCGSDDACKEPAKG